MSSSSERELRVLFVHRDPALASARIRILSLAPHLESLGLACRLVEHPRDPRELRRLLRTCETDLVVSQKKLPSLADAWAWRSRTAPVVFDYDDAILFRQEPRSGSHRSRTRARRFERMLRIADAFVCGNDYLASFCSGTGKPVLVAPSPLPLDVPRARPRREGPLRVGWLGSPGNLGSLDLLAPALRRLGDRHDIVFVVISERARALPGVRVVHVPWRLETQERDLADLHVGVMPLADSPWSRGKCAYKLLQYMAASLPVVASPVGMNRQVVEAGRNGLLASNEAEWLAALDRLVASPELAARLGAAGRVTAEGYGYPETARRWAAFLRARVRLGPEG